MKTIGGIVIGLILAVGVAVLAGPDSYQYSAGEAANLTRVCIPRDGNPTKIDTTASAGSSRLAEQTVYRVACTEDVYWEMGDGAAGTADSSSNYLPADTVEYIGTGIYGQSDFFSAVKVSTNGFCFVHRCD